MRPLLAALAFAAAACVATQLQHKCPGPCGDGQICDATVGECKDDPCGSRCNPQTQRCKAGPPARCVDINVGEANETGPGEPSAPSEPVPPATPRTH